MEFYITFKEFKENYEKDLTEWLNTYPDATEEDYIKEVFNYLDIRLSFFKREKDGIGLKDGFLIERYNRVDLEDYFIDGLYYAYCLENRILETIYNYYNSQINLGKIKESEVTDYMKNFSCLDGNKDPRYYLNEIQESKIYITPKFAKKFLNANRLKNGNEFDNFMIRKECMNMHLYFFSIESNYQDWEVSFNEEKYRNFGFAIKRIYEFLNNRLEELKNPPQQTETETKQQKYSNPLKVKILDELNVQGWLLEKGFTVTQIQYLLSDLFDVTDKSIRNYFKDQKYTDKAKTIINEIKNSKSDR